MSPCRLSDPDLATHPAWCDMPSGEPFVWRVPALASFLINILWAIYSMQGGEPQQVSSTGEFAPIFPTVMKLLLRSEIC